MLYKDLNDVQVKKVTEEIEKRRAEGKRILPEDIDKIIAGKSDALKKPAAHGIYKNVRRGKPSDLPYNVDSVLESNYGRILEYEKKHGIILAYWREPVTLILEPCGKYKSQHIYTPDWGVLDVDFKFRFHETKGFLYDYKRKKGTHGVVQLNHFKAYYPEAFREMRFVPQGSATLRYFRDSIAKAVTVEIVRAEDLKKQYHGLVPWWTTDMWDEDQAMMKGDSKRMDKQLEEHNKLPLDNGS